MKLSVIIPVFNEARTIGGVVNRCLTQDFPALDCEVIVVDDGSTDGTAEELTRWRDRVTLITCPRNRGKGAAVRAGLAHACGDIILIQDADGEYDVSDWPLLLAPIVRDEADVVFGTRFAGGTHRVFYFWHYLGNRILTFWSNMWTNLNLTDMETGAKAFRRAVAAHMRLRSDRFGFEPEFTAQVAHGGWRVYEVGISYRGRSYQEGKKITWRDGIAAIWHVVRSNIAAVWEHRKSLS